MLCSTDAKPSNNWSKIVPKSMPKWYQNQSKLAQTSIQMIPKSMKKSRSEKVSKTVRKKWHSGSFLGSTFSTKIAQKWHQKIRRANGPQACRTSSSMFVFIFLEYLWLWRPPWEPRWPKYPPRRRFGAPCSAFGAPRLDFWSTFRRPERHQQIIVFSYFSKSSKNVG